MPDNINVSMIGDAVVEAIKDSVKANVIEVDGLAYVDREVFVAPLPPGPDVIVIHTLTGLVDYVNNIAKIDPEAADKIKCVHVLGPHSVHVLGGLHGRNNVRYVYSQAVYEQPRNG